MGNYTKIKLSLIYYLIMIKEQINGILNGLTEIPAGQKPGETEIYEGEEGGTRFRIIRYRTPVVEVPFVRLTVFGGNGHKIAQDFIGTLGTPTCGFSSFVNGEEHSFDWHLTTSQP